jgi:hypothetical protein
MKSISTLSLCSKNVVLVKSLGLTLLSAFFVASAFVSGCFLSEGHFPSGSIGPELLALAVLIAAVSLFVPTLWLRKVLLTHQPHYYSFPVDKPKSLIRFLLPSLVMGFLLFQTDLYTQSYTAFSDDNGDGTKQTNEPAVTGVLVQSYINGSPV